MIVDIDDRESVQTSLERLSQDWFDPVDMFSSLKKVGKTDSPGLWREASHMLDYVSSYIGWELDRFLNEWDRRCIDNNTKFMGYHCTRHSDKRVFLEKGILPLSEETVKLFDDEFQTPRGRSARQDRSRCSPGPCFFLSYKSAKNPENHFFKGPEILLGCAGHHVGVDPAKSVPLIIHCSIPYLYLSERSHFAFCVLCAFFNFLDPVADSGDLFDGSSIDLRGTALDPRYIVRIEEALDSI